MALLASPLEAVLGGVVDPTSGWFVHPATDLSVQMVKSKAPVADLTRQKAGVNGTGWLVDSRTDLYFRHQTSVLESPDSYKISPPPLLWFQCTILSNNICVEANVSSKLVPNSLSHWILYIICIT